MEWVFRNILSFFRDILNEAMSLLSNNFNTAFDFGLDTFNRIFDGIFSNMLTAILIPTAVAIATIIMAWSLFKTTLSKSNSNNLDNPLELIMKTCGCMIVISAYGQITKYFVDFASTVFNAATGFVGNAQFGVNFAESKSFEEFVQTVVGKEVIMIALDLYFTYVIFSGYVKLLLMWGERYVYYGIIYYTLPLGISTMGSKTTEPIGKDFITSFFSALISLGFTGVYMRIYMKAIVSISSITNLSDYFITIALILGLSKFIMELDDFLNKIHLTNQGMSVADMGSPLKMFKDMIKTASSIARVGSFFSDKFSSKDKSSDGRVGRETISDRMTGIAEGNTPNNGTRAHMQSGVTNNISDNVVRAMNNGNTSNFQNALSNAFKNTAGGYASVTHNSDGSVSVRNGTMSGDEFGTVGKPLDLTNSNTSYFGDAIAEDSAGVSQMVTFNEDGSVTTANNDYADVSEFMKDTGITEVTPYHEEPIKGENVMRMSQDDNFKVTGMGMDGKNSFEGIRAVNGNIETFKGKVVGKEEANRGSIPIGNGKYVNISSATNVSQATKDLSQKYKADGNKIERIRDISHV